jgi:hypothetical protein
LQGTTARSSKDGLAQSAARILVSATISGETENERSANANTDHQAQSEADTATNSKAVTDASAKMTAIGAGDSLVIGSETSAKEVDAAEDIVGFGRDLDIFG